MGSFAPDVEHGVARRVAGSALALVGRRVALTAITSTATAIIARELGLGAFGSLASALGAYYLALGVVDLGFGLALARELANRPDARARLLATAFRVQGAWAVAIALAVAIFALVAGVHTTRGGALLVLAPAVAAAGLGASRQLFIAVFSTKRLTVIDLATNTVASATTIALAASGAGTVWVAAALSAGSVVNSLLVAAASRRLVSIGRPDRAEAHALIRYAVPLGVSSLLSSVYFSIDLVLLGWLVAPTELGAYGAASKILTLLVMLPALTLSAALPGFAILDGDRDALALLTGRVWHWLATFGLPLCTGAFVFAGPIVRIAFGDGFSTSVPLVRVLAVAAAIAVFANVLGTVLVALRIVRPVIVINLTALVVNVVGNLLLVPSHGVVASAWLTVATELLVAVGSLVLVREALGSIGALRQLGGPLAANAAFAAVGYLLLARPFLAVPAALLALAAATQLLHAWPADPRAALPRATGA